MKKLLLLAIIGLVLGGGIWKSQNPEGTIAQFKDQSMATAARLTAGVQAGIETIRDQPVAVEQQALAREALENRLDSLETQLVSTSDNSLEDQVTDMISTGLTDTQATVQSLSTRVDDLAEKLENLAVETATEQQRLDTNLNSLTEKTDEMGVRIGTMVAKLDAAASRESEAALTTQSEPQGQIAAVETRPDDVRSTDPEQQSTMVNVREKVEQLRAEQLEQLKAQSESNAVEYRVYFERGSAGITDDAAQMLNSFIAQEQNRTTGVSIFGFTDRMGSAEYNQQLALQRATSVRSYLVENGLDYASIKTLSGLGEDAAVQVLANDDADANKRVVILFADQP